MEIFCGLKCSVKCVECRGSVGCVCDGHWWVLQVLLLGGAEFESALPHWCNVHGVNAFVVLFCFFTVVLRSYHYYNCYCVYIVVSQHHCIL